MPRMTMVLLAVMVATVIAIDAALITCFTSMRCTSFERVFWFGAQRHVDQANFDNALRRMFP